ncbi:MAG: HEAT repeat domain-containing protein [Thaumarchaeota archaeon]|nr:HEAT repeat domain-containing protein [Nitrososphaerota archaeon]
MLTRKDGDLAKLIECDKAFKKMDLNFFIDLLQQDESISVRTRCVCILADIGDNSVVPVLPEILKNDETSLVRHEDAFTFGQLGFPQCVTHLIEAMLTDIDHVVRHESAVALGSIGDEVSRDALVRATSDEDQLVSHSAHSSLLNLDLLKINLNKNSSK